jgi:hypothetical protein
MVCGYGHGGGPIMDPFDFYDYRKHNFRKKKMVQDAFIVLTAPLLMLVGMLIARFLSLY